MLDRSRYDTARGPRVADKTILKLEYKKFNTFLFDYLRSLNRGWIFMKMKHKYPVGTVLNFVMSISGMDEPLKLSGTVVHHGVNDEGKEGVGVRLTADGGAAADLRRRIGAHARQLFGEQLAGRIMAVAEAQDRGAE